MHAFVAIAVVINDDYNNDNDDDGDDDDDYDNDGVAASLLFSFLSFLSLVG